MLYPICLLPSSPVLKNLIFDFGGVICDLDVQKTVNGFRAFGLPKDNRPGAKEKGDSAFDLLIRQLETGSITPGEFRSVIRGFYSSAPSDAAINEAWNAMLGGIPVKRIRLLLELRKDYRIFLLSNSNQIHYDCFRMALEQEFGYRDFDALFEKAWFSFRIGLRKPDPAIFSWVLKDKELVPSETLFIDDTPENTESAISAGIHACYLKPGEEITTLFGEM